MRLNAAAYTSAVGAEQSGVSDGVCWDPRYTPERRHFRDITDALDGISNRIIASIITSSFLIAIT